MKRNYNSCHSFKLMSAVGKRSNNIPQYLMKILLQDNRLFIDIRYFVTKWSIACAELKIISTRMHSSRMRTARSSSSLLRGVRGVCLSAYWDTHLPRAWAWTGPGPGHPWAWIPLGLSPDTPTPWAWAWTPPPPGHGHPPGPESGHPPGLGLDTPLAGHVTCKACWDTPPPVDRITDTCKNITFANFVCGW